MLEVNFIIIKGKYTNEVNLLSILQLKLKNV